MTNAAPAAALPEPDAPRLRWRATAGALGAAYLASGLLAGGGPPGHLHSLYDLIRHSGAWSLLAVPALVALRAIAVAAAIDVAGVLTGWGARFPTRLRAALAGEGVFAAACLAQALAGRAGYPTEPPPFSAAALLGALAEDAGAGRDWVHALPQMVGLDDLAFVLVVAFAWSRIEARPFGGALRRTAAGYGSGVALLLGVLTLMAL